jgi:RNA polymerase sigma-70 factor (ECF subfamily)
VAVDGRARTHPADFELEISTQRWQWSPEFYDLLGAPPSRPPSTGLLLASKHPDDRALTASVLTEALVGGRSFCFQSRNVRGDGYQCRVEATGTVALTSDGAPGTLIGSAVVLADWAAPVFEEPLVGASSEGELAVALLARIEQAHAYVFRQYAAMVAQASRRVLRNGGQVDDVVQSVFEGLWCHPARFDPTRGSLAKYLQLMARARSIDIVRSESALAERSVRFSGGTGHVNGPEDDVVGALSEAEMRKRLDLLPDTERTPIELAYFGDMTYRMVAENLGLPEGTVKSRIRSGLTRLADDGEPGGIRSGHTMTLVG